MPQQTLYFVQGFGNDGAELTRIDYMNGRNYQNAYAPGEFYMANAYQGIMEDIRLMNLLALEAEQLIILEWSSITIICNDDISRFLWRCPLFEALLQKTQILELIVALKFMQLQ